ncbi:MAG TPA: argininosuccinate lyase [Acidobacteria bacterium]|nr:argininosuccinate lyase [Acidobacteriota bacterium]
MSGTLWGSGRPLDERLDAYTVGEDRELDGRLLPWDIVGSMAHAAGLVEAGVLSRAEGERVHAALVQALEDGRAGRLVVGPGDEDVHSALERYLTARLGDLGRKIHAGRSRNDQVQVDLRLHVKDRLFELAGKATATARALLDFAARHREVLWPGYTHLRRAMPSTVGLWAAGAADAILDSLGNLDAAFRMADACPLGSGAGYGVPLELPRDRIAHLLGFARVQHTVTAAQWTRGKLETTVLQSLWPLAHDLGKLSWDVILFSMDELGYLRLPAGLTTGSSIMPHKKNPDLFELTRARAAAFDGLIVEAMAVSGKLPGGYHRDLQLTKGPLLRGLASVIEMAEIVGWAVPQIEVDRRRCEEAVGGDLLATDEVFAAVRRGVPFRTAYREVAARVAAGEAPPPLDREAILMARSSTGNAGNLGLPSLRRRLAAIARRWEARRRAFRQRLDQLIGGGEA